MVPCTIREYTPSLSHKLTHTQAHIYALRSYVHVDTYRRTYWANIFLKSFCFAFMCACICIKTNICMFMCLNIFMCTGL